MFYAKTFAKMLQIIYCSLNGRRTRGAACRHITLAVSHIKR